MIHLGKIFLSILLIFPFYFCLEQNLEISNVERTIRLSSQIARHSHNISIQNVGQKSISTFLLTVEENLAERLSLIEVSKGGEEMDISIKDIIKTQDSKKGYTIFEVQLKKSLEAAGKVNLEATYVFTHVMVPYPAEIRQQDKQYVRYLDNHFFFSPYKVKSQKTEVQLPSASTLSNSEEPPTTKRGDTIVYGPYLDVEPFHFSQMDLHFENNKPFITVTSMIKDIEVSHWGNVAVEETFALQHDGAKLKGTFSRYDYQRFASSNHAVVQTMTQILPEGASDVYYRDEIGNITTSHLSETDRGITFEISPRYPLFGGWKAQFYMGYNLPMSKYLFSSAKASGVYILEIPFATNFDDAVIDDLKVRVILPEGATNIEVSVPFGIDNQSTETHYTYLDTFGRPVVVLEKRNVISDHNRLFQVRYTFGTLAMLREPLLLVGAFFILFIIVMLYYRFEFKIGESEQKERQKIQDVIYQLKDLIDEQNSLTERWENATEKFINTQDLGRYNDERKTAQDNLSKNAEKVQRLVEQLISLDGEVGKIAQTVAEKSKEKIKVIRQKCENEIDYQKKSIKKSAYEKLKAKHEEENQGISNEIESLVDELVEL